MEIIILTYTVVTFFQSLFLNQLSSTILGFFIILMLWYVHSYIHTVYGSSLHHGEQSACMDELINKKYKKKIQVMEIHFKRPTETQRNTPNLITEKW